MIHLENGFSVGVEDHETFGPGKEVVAARNADSLVLQSTDAEVVSVFPPA